MTALFLFDPAPLLTKTVNIAISLFLNPPTSNDPRFYVSEQDGKSKLKELMDENKCSKKNCTLYVIVSNGTSVSRLPQYLLQKLGEALN